MPQTPDDGRGALDYVRYRDATFHIELNVRGMKNWRLLARLRLSILIVTLTVRLLLKLLLRTKFRRLGKFITQGNR